MCDPRVIHRLAGTLIIVSALLGFTVSIHWFALAAFVGANLLQMSFTGFCPAERIFGHFKAFGCRPALAHRRNG